MFRYPRPEVDHIPLPETFDSEALKELLDINDKTNDGWVQNAASDVSDSEGDPSDGRISPCTFLHWAEGAKRWDAPGDKNRSRWETRKTYDIPVSAT